MLIAEPDVLSRARSDVDRARRQLDLLGVAAIHPACIHLEIASARLHPYIAHDDVSQEFRRTAERCRATLCSHLLAAENLEAAGVPETAIVQLLRRATDAFGIAVESTANGRGVT
jgi:hypothetical protein